MHLQIGYCLSYTLLNLKNMSYFKEILSIDFSMQKLHIILYNNRVSSGKLKLIQNWLLREIV